MKIAKKLPRPRLDPDQMTVRMDFHATAGWKQELLDYCNRNGLPMSLVIREAVTRSIGKSDFLDHALREMMEGANVRGGVRSPGVPVA